VLFGTGRFSVEPVPAIGGSEAEEPMTTALVTEPETSLAAQDLRPLPQACRLCGAQQPPAPVAICEECLGPLEPVYDPDRPLPDAATIASRPG
jgi:threonine synthase